jgi:hypothetical protein
LQPRPEFIVADLRPAPRPSSASESTCAIRTAARVLDTALVLAHIEIDEKSNEIPAVQKLLEELDVARHIVTLDAMHCQKTFENRRRRQAHLIVQLKDNQPTFDHTGSKRCRSLILMSCGNA